MRIRHGTVGSLENFPLRSELLCASCVGIATPCAEPFVGLAVGGQVRQVSVVIAEHKSIGRYFSYFTDSRIARILNVFILARHTVYAVVSMASTVLPYSRTWRTTIWKQSPW